MRLDHVHGGWSHSKNHAITLRILQAQDHVVAAGSILTRWCAHFDLVGIGHIPRFGTVREGASVKKPQLQSLCNGNWTFGGQHTKMRFSHRTRCVECKIQIGSVSYDHEEYSRVFVRHSNIDIEQVENG